MVTHGYTSTDSEKDFSVSELLRKALKKFAWDEYNGVVGNIPVFVEKFNERSPEFKERLGNKAGLYNAEQLNAKGWK